MDTQRMAQQRMAQPGAYDEWDTPQAHQGGNRASRRSVKSKTQVVSDRPGAMQISLGAAGRIVEGLASIAAFGLSIAAGLASKIFDLISWVSNGIVELTGGEGKPQGHRSAKQTLQDKFLDALILASVGWTANQWALKLASFGWFSMSPVWVLLTAGLTTTLFTQCIQSRFLRNDNPETQKEIADKYSKYQRLDVSEDLITVAQQKTREYNNSGVKSGYIIGAIVVATWAIEIDAMGTGVAWPAIRFSLATFATLCWLAVQAFSTEALIKLKEARAE
jgi:hypothetical protein